MREMESFFAVAGNAMNDLPPCERLARLKAIFGFEKAVRIKAHFAVYPARHARRPPVEAFLTWLHNEASKT